MKSFFFLAIGICLILSCSKNSVEQEQDLCKEATSVPKITFVKLANTFSNKAYLLGGKIKQDSIAVTFKYQDTEADIGTSANQKIVNGDGIDKSVFIDLFKKNTDGTFTKLSLLEPYNFSILPVPTQGGLIIKGSNYPVVITSFSSCSGEITCSMIFEFPFLQNVKLALNDKVKFAITLKDRATHFSNIIETTETTISENL